MSTTISKSIPSYEEARQEIIADMKNVSATDKKFEVTVGNKSYSADEIVTEVENETEFGKDYVNNFIEGLKLLQTKK